jgi:hypothetical protein
VRGPLQAPCRTKRLANPAIVRLLPVTVFPSERSASPRAKRAARCVRPTPSYGTSIGKLADAVPIAQVTVSEVAACGVNENVSRASDTSVIGASAGP